MSSFKSLAFATALGALTLPAADAALVITGVFDGPLTGGTPKGIELFATTDIADLSVYSVANYNNGNTTATSTFALSGSITAGEYLYVAYDAGANPDNFETYFGTGLTLFIGNVLNINGDDAIGLLLSSTLVDVFGEIGTDGSGTAWDYLDGWAYRNDYTPVSTTFDEGGWTFSGIDALDGTTTNATAGNPVPIGTFVPEPASVLLGSLGMLTLLFRRRN